MERVVAGWLLHGGHRQPDPAQALPRHHARGVPGWPRQQVGG